jgi:hypothetical protein
LKLRALAPLVTCAVLVLGGCSPSFTGADGSHGYGATATLEAKPDAKHRFVAVFGIETRESLSRFELRSMALSDTTNPKAAAALPPIPSNLVFVVDRGTREITVWSPQAKRYYHGSLDRLQAGDSGATPAASPEAPAAGANPGAAPEPAVSASPAPRKPRAAPWLPLLKHLPTVTLSVAGAGSEIVDGHVTTALDISATMASPKPPAKKTPAQKSPPGPTALSKFLVHVNLADEFDGFPLSIRVRVPDSRPGKAPLEVRLHMTDVLATSPPQSDFAPPAGYEAVETPATLLAPPGALPPS